MWQALEISLKVWLFIVPLLLLIGGWGGYRLARGEFSCRRAVSLLIQLPIILPPSVLGFYLLSLCGSIPFLKNGGLLFAFPAVVLGALVPSLPIMIQSARSAFTGVDRELEDAARILGRPNHEVFFRITLPLARRPLLVGLALSSARAIGDFGVTLMIAGNIPGVTQTLPLYIYEQVDGMHFAEAHLASALLLILGVLGLMVAHCLEPGRHEARHAS